MFAVIQSVLHFAIFWLTNTFNIFNIVIRNHSSISSIVNDVILRIIVNIHTNLYRAPDPILILCSV